jgi:hypothetical protein
VSGELPVAPYRIFATPGSAVGYQHAVEVRGRRVGHVDGEPLRAGPVEEEPVGELANPTLGAPHLLGRPHDRLAEPPAPVDGEVAGVGEGADLVGKDEDVVAEDDQEVADLLALPAGHLVPADAGVAPQ